MSVIGIDLGNESCYIAVARQGGIETISNDFSLRATPTYVAFGERNRILGVAAKSQTITNIKNTCYGFKKLIGKSYKDPRVRDELASLPYRTVETSDGGIGIVVRYQNEEQTFTATQITAMLFTKLKQTAEAALEIKVNDCVIGVPCYFDDAERRAMLQAATAAGLNVLRLMNETTATALAYGIYKQDLPAPEEKPRNVVFVDYGHSCMQVCTVAFNKGKLKMLASTADSTLGGREFDKLLVNSFAHDFKSRYKIDAFTNHRALVRLYTEVEKLKKQMSANSTELPINIECFMEDKDVTGKMKREVLEAMSTSLLHRTEQTMSECLQQSGLKVDDVYSVEIVGGSTRIPSVKHLIEKVFKKVPSTTLNQDEAVARGCALQCAMLSPAFKVREFSITDVQPYSIKLVWQDESGQTGDMEVFKKNHPVPFSKILTFYRKEPFVLQGQYSHPSPSPDPSIGIFTVRNVAPNAEGESQKIKVKVRVNIHGLFTVASASLTEKKEVLAEEAPASDAATTDAESKKENVPNGEDKKENAQTEEKPTDEQTNKEEQSEIPVDQGDQAAPGEKKMKKVTKTVDLPVDEVVKGLSQTDLNNILELEAQMVAADKLENERINAKNAVEEYVYDIRSRICEDLEQFISPDDASKYTRFLEDTENWLYEDGEDCAKHVYVDKLAELKKHGEPVKTRKMEREELPIIFEMFLKSLQQAKKVCLMFSEGDEKYNHLDTAEVEKVQKAIAERQQWIDTHFGLLSSTPMHQNVPITAAQVKSEKGTFEALCNPIINKPKPKPKVEEPPPAEKTSEPNAPEQNAQDAPKDPNAPKDKPGNPPEPMDVD